jgi:hypothetical protein
VPKFNITFNRDSDGPDQLSREALERIGDKIVDLLSRQGIKEAMVSITY